MTDTPITTDYPITMDADKNFRTRLVTMMKDYNISLNEAMEWDFEGFHNDVDRSEAEGMLEPDFHYYLFQNKVDPSHYCWYTDIFMGRQSDMKLRNITPRA